MATVRFSQQLKDNIRGNARRLYKQAIDNAKKDVPAHWADKIYECLFPADVIAKFNALPDYALRLNDSINFNGFENAPSDVYQTAEHNTNTWTCSEVSLNFSSPRRFPHNQPKEVMGFEMGYRGKADFNDTRWDWLKPEFKEYTRKIFEAEAKEAKFLDGVDKLTQTYTTLAPALKAWPALWDLLDDDVKERHKKVVERGAKDVGELDVDLNDMTAAVTFSKLTR
jgi:hypothetical protein